VTKPEKEVMLGWTVHQLVDDQGYLSTGKLSMKLWGMELRKKGKHGKPPEPDVTFIHRATTSQNGADAHAATLTIQLDEFNLPVVAPTSERIREPNSKIVGPEIPLKSLGKVRARTSCCVLAFSVELCAQSLALVCPPLYRTTRSNSKDCSPAIC
jgi:hypothetical protein